MIYGGIDPGKEGALALLSEDGLVIELEMMPVVKAVRGRDEYDLVAIRETLVRWREAKAFVTVEKLQPMPIAKGGTIANFNRGVCHGWAWMLAGLRIPYSMVAPQTWQARMHEGTPGEDTKQRSILAAQRLFPGVNLARSERAKKHHDGKAEALLIAEFGRRSHAALPAAGVAP